MNNKLRLKALRAYNNIQENEVLVLVDNQSEVTELICDTEKATGEDLATLNKSYSILLEDDYLSFKVLPIGTDYIIYKGKVVPILTKVFTAG